MPNPVLKRISQIIDYQYKKNKSSFLKKTGIKDGTFYSMYKNDSYPSYDTIIRVLKAHKKINPYWFILGEGEMELNKIEQLELNLDQLKEENKVLREQLQAIEKERDYLKEINELLKKK